MSLRARNIFTVALLAASVCAASADAQQPSKAADKPAQAPSAKQPEKSTPRADTQQPAAAGGLVVFIDPATGQIRQPDAAEIGALSGSGSAPANAAGANAPAMARRPVERPVEFRGVGNIRGIKLGEDSQSYSVVTRTPDGKLVGDCVTGDKAAAELVSKGVAPKKATEVLDEK
jgi:hypothetical protein